MFTLHLHMLSLMGVVVVVVADWAHCTEVVTVVASLFALEVAGCTGLDRARSSSSGGHGGGEGEG
jgi:hypothetical protein